MEGLSSKERARLGALLETKSQAEVMAMIPQFTQSETGHFAGSRKGEDSFGAMVFNIERGVNLAETIDFLTYCPDIRPDDLIFANELDDGCVRSGGRQVACEIARACGYDYVWGLEFIELASPDDPKGFHGNAIFSRYPITWSEVFRLPEENNWYFDRQKRIGGRCAIFAKVKIGEREIGAVSIHLENRTDGAGRRRQLRAILDEADRVFAGLPVLMGGDLNTNTFDGRSVPAISFLSEHPDLLAAQMLEVEDYEPCLADCEKYGYDWQAAAAVGQEKVGTRRKPLPDGTEMLLRLDWLLPRGLTASDGKIISTLAKDCTFAPAGSALAGFTKKELSDHNAVRACFHFQ